MKKKNIQTSFFGEEKESAPIDSQKKGALCWWSIEDVVHANHNRIREGFEKHLAEFANLVPEPIYRIGAYRRAASLVNPLEGYWFEHGSNEEGNIFTLAYDENGDDLATDEIKTRVLAQILIPFKDSEPTKRIKLPPESDPLFPETIEAIKDLEARALIEGATLNASDVRGLLSEVLIDKMQGFRAKKGGSIYFIPPAYLERLPNLGPILENEGIQFKIFSIAGNEAAQMASVASEALAEEAAEIRASLEKLSQDFADKGEKAKLRSTTVMKRKLAIETLKERAKTYRALFEKADLIASETMQNLEQLAQELAAKAT